MTDKRPSGYGAVLRNRDFFILWSGSLISSLGDALRNIALLWLVKELTGSNLAMGTVMLFSMLPYLLLGLFAGAIVDLADRKKIMVWSDVIRGGLSLSVPLLLATGHLAFWHLCAMAFLMSSVSAFFQPAMQASIPNVVGRDHLITANALGSLTFQISGIVGPALGGAIVGLAGTQPAFIADGVSFLVSAAAILLARIPGARPAAGQPRPNVARVLSGVKEGFAFIASRRLLLSLVVMALVVNFISAPIMVLMANHVDTAWHAGAQGYGLLGSALSLGALVSTLVLGAVAARFKAQRLAVVGLAAMGLCTLALVPASRLEHGVAIFLALGLANPVINIPLITWLQKWTPDRVRGRVSSAVQVGAMAATPLALGLAGWASDVFGTRSIFAAAGLVTVAGALFLVWAFRAYRRDLEELESGAQGPAATVEQTSPSAS
jgi:DHA3 family macrolide efflux protein-like MFS transporter